ncbi:MAG: SUMF1/EgtB/PvdO family nonheme iron enzyme [Planctomycetota bacterium]
MALAAPLPGLRVRCVLLAALTLWAAPGCDSRADADAAPGGAASSVASRLEALAFVPGGQTAIDSAIDVRVDVDLLVDVYEMTVGEWSELFGDDDPIPDAFRAPLRGGAAQPTSWATDVPVVGMPLLEARRAAALRGMRLPTTEEWVWCAIGPRSRRYPAGRRQRGLANTLELELFRRTPVGAFESGRTPLTGIFDLLGNVWEWTDPPRPAGDWRVINAGAWPIDGGRSAPAWVLGGSYLTPARAMFGRDRSLLAQGATAQHRASDLGLRCVADAAEYLAALPRLGPLEAGLRSRLRAVGARWGARSVTLLESVAGADPDNRWVAELLAGARG